MSGMTLLDALILGTLEGLTEYLPVSSTGHLIIGAHFLGLESNAFLKSFEIVIQSGAILSVLIVYWRRFFQNWDWGFYQKIVVSFLPAAVIGFALKKVIDHMLESWWTVAATMFLGGVFLIWMERKRIFEQNQKTINQLTVRDCLLLGLFQCLAMIPGTSRSGATIVGGLFLGLRKDEATQFSFFLAVPTLVGASVLKFQDAAPYLTNENATLLAAGWLMSFFIGVVAIKGFIRIVSTQGFTGFGLYRILFALLAVSALYEF
ncbi:MAG: undecaprenyl-diphosphate phosphatase [Bdellovibrionales bacterium]